MPNLYDRLAKAYNDTNSPVGKAERVILFGINNSLEIVQTNLSKASICKLAGLTLGYGAELNKGVNLAKVVKEI